MAKFISNLFSYVFHPLWMPIIGFVLITGIDVFLIGNESSYYAILGVLAINTLAPAAMVLLMVNMKMISGVNMSHQKERTIPLLFVLAFYAFCYGLLQSKNLPISNLIFSFILGVILILFVGIVVNLKWKISIHMLAMGGTLGLIYGVGQIHQIDITFVFVVGVFIAGVLAFSRLFLKAHTSAQVYVGLIVGFLIQYTLVFNKFYLMIF